MEAWSPVSEDLWIEAYREPGGGGGDDPSLPEHFNSSLILYQENQIEVYDAGNHVGGKKKNPGRLEKKITHIFASLSQSFEGTSKWSVCDSTTGLWKLYRRHKSSKERETIIGHVVRNEFEIKELLEWLDWSFAAYSQHKLAFLETLNTKVASQLQVQDVVHLVTNSGINKPAYFIAVHHARMAVVMGIRGTSSISDFLTDLLPHNEPFLGGAAHSGMLRAAKWFFENERHRLTALLEEYPGYKLVLTGHSLGGAIASLLSMLLMHGTEGGPFSPQTTILGIHPCKLFCFGFGCAPCVDRNLAESSNYIVNVVLQDDIVPRFGPIAIEVLRQEIQETGRKKEGKAKKVMKFIEQVKGGNVIKNGSKAGASMFQIFQRAHVAAEDEPSSSTGNQLMLDGAANNAYEWTSTDAQAIVPVPTGSQTNIQELKLRQLYVPGVLYHIERFKINKGDRVAPKFSKFRHEVRRGTDVSSRFRRIILSSTILSDHSCSKYEEGMLDAVQSFIHHPLDGWQ